MRLDIYNALKNKNIEYKATLESYAPYINYLQCVYDMYGDKYLINDTQELYSIVTRYDTLIQTNNDLCAKQSELLDIYEKLRIDYLSYKQSQSTYILSLQNDIVNINQLLDQQINQSYAAKQQYITAEHDISQHMKLLTQVCMSVDNIYDRCKKQISRISTSGQKIKHNNSSNENNNSSNNNSTASTKHKYLFNSDTYHHEIIDKMRDIQTYMSDFQSIINTCGADDNQHTNNTHSNNNISNQQHYNTSHNNHTVGINSYHSHTKSSSNNNRSMTMNQSTRNSAMTNTNSSIMKQSLSSLSKFNLNSSLQLPI